jgi:hypothetical protein
MANKGVDFRNVSQENLYYLYSRVQNSHKCLDAVRGHRIKDVRWLVQIATQPVDSGSRVPFSRVD